MLPSPVYLIRLPLHTFFNKPSLCASRFSESSPSPHRPHEATQRIHLVLARVPAVLVHFADGDLHGGVVFGFDDAVCRAAFAGDVAGRRGGELVRILGGRCCFFGVGEGAAEEGGGGREEGIRLQVNELAFVVFHLVYV